jgi:hypothetical protein
MAGISDTQKKEIGSEQRRKEKTERITRPYEIYHQ